MLLPPFLRRLASRFSAPRAARSCEFSLRKVLCSGMCYENNRQNYTKRYRKLVLQVFRCYLNYQCAINARHVITRTLDYTGEQRKIKVGKCQGCFYHLKSIGWEFSCTNLHRTTSVPVVVGWSPTVDLAARSHARRFEHWPHVARSDRCWWSLARLGLQDSMLRPGKNGLKTDGSFVKVLMSGDFLLLFAFFGEKRCRKLWVQQWFNILFWFLHRNPKVVRWISSEVRLETIKSMKDDNIALTTSNLRGVFFILGFASGNAGLPNEHVHNRWAPLFLLQQGLNAGTFKSFQHLKRPSSFAQHLGLKKLGHQPPTLLL